MLSFPLSPKQWSLRYELNYSLSQSTSTRDTNDNIPSRPKPTMPGRNISKLSPPFRSSPYLSRREPIRTFSSGPIHGYSTGYFTRLARSRRGQVDTAMAQERSKCPHNIGGLGCMMCCSLRAPIGIFEMPRTKVGSKT